MQQRLDAGYAAAGARLGAAVVPVGDAWAEALRGRPGLDLWQGDDHHPTTAGSYLAACVFADALTGRDVRGDSYTAGLDPAEARFLQTVAAGTAGMG
jgi:hypothetical protein